MRRIHALPTLFAALLLCTASGAMAQQNVQMGQGGMVVDTPGAHVDMSDGGMHVITNGARVDMNGGVPHHSGADAMNETVTTTTTINTPAPAGGSKTFSNTNLREMNFGGQNLQGSTFSNSDATNVSFSGTNLQNASFSNADFSNVDFSNADLRGATFSNVDFKGGDLRGALVQGASFSNVTFEGTKVGGVDFSGATMSNCDFDKADYTASATTSSTNITQVLTEKPTAGKTVEINLAIHFASGSDKLEQDGLSQVNELAKALQTPALANARFLIEGHTDSDDTDEHNIKLSERRAERVVSVLTQDLGISPSRLEAKWYGESKPVADNGTRMGKFQNRRVTVVRVN